MKFVKNIVELAPKKRFVLKQNQSWNRFAKTLELEAEEPLKANGTSALCITITQKVTGAMAMVAVVTNTAVAPKIQPVLANSRHESVLARLCQ